MIQPPRLERHHEYGLWTSRENAPGQSILLSGAFTDAPKTARLALIPPGTADWQSLVRGSTTVIPTTQQGTTGLSSIVPVGFPAGVYGYQIEEPTLGPNGEKLIAAPPILGLANAPLLNWAIGVPSVTDPSAALQHHVYDCGAETGGILRLFERNFVASNKVILQSSSGVAYSLAPSKIDSNSITVPIPGSITREHLTSGLGAPPGV
jgi:hypothetical protein